MLKIGDFSKLSRVSIRMLRHYDEIGLLAPGKVDAFTGYRYYGEEQLPTIYRINALKEMGFGLAEIREILLIYDDRERLDGYLAAREAELLVLADETARRMLLLDTARKRLRKEENMNYNVNVKIIPQRQAACVRMILPRYEDEGLAWQTLLSETDSQHLIPDNPLPLLCRVSGRRIQREQRGGRGTKDRQGQLYRHGARAFPHAARRYCGQLHFPGRIRSDERRIRRHGLLDSFQRLRLRGPHVQYLSRQPSRDPKSRGICDGGMLPGSKEITPAGAEEKRFRAVFFP